MTVPIHAVPENRAQSGISTRHIAIVDDDEAVCRALARLLRAFSHQVRTYRSGREFLNSLNIAVPTCVIVDLQMDDMTGLELLRNLADTGAKIPAIVVTAHDEAGMRHRCEAAGAAAFLVKPVMRDPLLDAIRAATGGAQPSSNSEIERGAQLLSDECQACVVAEISKLPAYERIGHYRRLAKELRDEAAAPGNSDRKSYLWIAEEWEQLAAQVKKRFAN
jgi:FixJ family two-component response regulator